MDDRYAYGLNSFDQPEDPGADPRVQKTVRRVLTYLMSQFPGALSVNVQLIYRERHGSRRIRAHSSIAAVPTLVDDPQALVMHHQQAFILHETRLCMDSPIWECAPVEVTLHETPLQLS